MKEYEEVRSSLLSMLEELDDRLATITDDIKHSGEPLEKDFEEQAVQAENDEVMDCLGNRARTEIDKIKQAIVRIDKGQYGVCENCGEPINPERLKALPFSGLCIECARMNER